MELKWESLVRRCSVEKLFLKIQKILRKIYVPESRECGKDNSLWFCGIFRNIYFAEHLWTHTCVKWSNEKNVLTNIFPEKQRWWCLLKYSCRIESWEHRCLQFYWKGIQSQTLACKTCEVLQSITFTGQLLQISRNIFDVSLSLSWIYQFSHN